MEIEFLESFNIITILQLKPILNNFVKNLAKWVNYRQTISLI